MNSEELKTELKDIAVRLANMRDDGWVPQIEDKLLELEFEIRKLEATVGHRREI